MNNKVGTMGRQFSDFGRILRQRLVSLRLARKLTATDAAALASLSRAGLEKIESGANTPSLDSLLRLCALYNVSVSALLRSVEEQLGIANALETEFELKTSRKEEYQEHFKKLALLTGHSEEHETIAELRLIAEKQPVLARSLQAAVREAARAVGRHRARSPRETEASI